MTSSALLNVAESVSNGYVVPDVMEQMLTESILLRSKVSWMTHIVLSVAMGFGTTENRMRLTVRNAPAVE